MYTQEEFDDLLKVATALKDQRDKFRDLVISWQKLHKKQENDFKELIASWKRIYEAVKSQRDQTLQKYKDAVVEIECLSKKIEELNKGVVVSMDHSNMDVVQ